MGDTIDQEKPQDNQQDTQQENQQNNTEREAFTIKMPLPANHKKGNFKARHTKNAYFIDYSLLEMNENEGYIYPIYNEIKTSQMYPFTLTDIKGSIENNVFTLNFRKGTTLAHGFNDIEVSRGEGNIEGDNGVQNVDGQENDQDVAVEEK